MKMMRAWCAIALLMAAAAVPVVSSAVTCPSVGGTAPLLSGADTAGRFQQLDDYRGKWVYVDFWATWCAPCMKELPKVVALHEQMQTRSDFAVLSVSLDEKSMASDLLTAAQTNGIAYPVLYDGNGWNSANARGWCVNAIPATFLVDPQGKVVAEDIAPQDVARYLPSSAPGSPTRLTPPPAPAPIQPSAAEPYQPELPRCSELLLSDSPSSGRRAFRDLQVCVNVPAPHRGVYRYQLNVKYRVAGQGGVPRDYWQRYDLDIALDAGSKTRPAYVTIRDTSGQVGVGCGMCVVVNPQTFCCDLVVPVPAAAEQVAYTLALYDEHLDRFFDNGPVRVR